jgi:hypothetical protein
MQMVLREVDFDDVDWIDLAQDRAQWQVLYDHMTANWPIHKEAVCCMDLGGIIQKIVCKEVLLIFIIRRIFWCDI